MSDMNFGFGMMGGGIDDFDEEDFTSPASADAEYEPEPDYEDADLVEATFTKSSMDGMSARESRLIESHEAVKNINLDEMLPANETVKEDEVEFTSETHEAEVAEQQAKQDELRTVVVDSYEWIVEQVKEGVSIMEKTSSEKGKARTYNKKAEMPKIVYAKAKGQSSFASKLMKFGIACTAVGAFVGVYANSYAAVNPDATAMSCSYSWILSFDTLAVTMTPFNFSAFFAGFGVGFGLLGIIGLFIWLDADAKKQSRVGHEHGSAHLGTNRDFKIYKNKFMER